ncbi:MAG: D-mannonate epimerase, partial [Planctomycetota bacterium]
MLLYSRGHENDDLSSQDLRDGLYAALEKLGPKQKVLAIPPDFTRCHSRAGELTYFAWQYYGSNLTDILPALGTHSAMTKAEIKQM